MKRILKSIGAIIIGLSLLFSNAQSIKVYSADEKSLVIDIGENFGNSGSNISVPVYLSDSPESGIAAMNMIFEFDEGLILSNVKSGYLINDTSDFSYSIKDNKVRILYSDSKVGKKTIKGNGVLCYLEFRISPSTNRESFTIRRIISDNDVFIDNYMNKINADFLDGKLIKRDNLYTVARDKSWRITFNQEVDSTGLNDGSVEVKGINGDIIPCKFYLNNSNKTLEIFPPYEGYSLYNSYSVTIKRSFASKSGKILSKEQIINFYIEK